MINKQPKKEVSLTNMTSPGTADINASSNLQNMQIRIFVFNALRLAPNSRSKNLLPSQFSISELNCQPNHKDIHHVFEKNRPPNDQVEERNLITVFCLQLIFPPYLFDSNITGRLQCCPLFSQNWIASFKEH